MKPSEIESGSSIRGAAMKSGNMRATVMSAVVILLAVSLVPVGASVSPVLENVTDRCDGTFLATFGYENTSSGTVTLPIGPSNNFSGTDAVDAGQPTDFAPGRRTNVFNVIFDGSNIVWTLDGRTETASGNAADNTCGFSPVSPVLERVKDNCDGTYTAWFGYDNPNSDTVTIEIGEYNRFTGTENRGQPVTFAPGRKVEVYSVEFNGENLVWTLSGRTSTASAGAAQNRCGTEPVSPVLERVVDDCDSGYTAWFGYNNENDTRITISHGDDNILVSRMDQPQPEVFEPGRIRDVFTVKFDGSDLVWKLDGRTATANASVAVEGCPAKAISPVLEYVVDNCDSTYTAHFGYYNRNDYSAFIDYGNKNKIVGKGTGYDHGQPNTFAPGRGYDVFTIDFTGAGTRIVWALDGRTATASGTAAKNTCGPLPVHPVLDRVKDECNGTYTAFWGYLNENDTRVTIPVGDGNSFSGLGYQPQPAIFEPGRVTNAFSVNFSGDPIVWNIQGRTETASGDMSDDTCLCTEPIIVHHPRTDTAAVGESVTFSVIAEGQGLTYQWKRNDDTIPGAHGPEYTVSSVKGFNHMDEYRVLVANWCRRSLQSEIALLYVRGSVRCVVTEHPQSDTIEVGYPFVARVRARCESVTYQWIRDGEPIPGAEGPELITDPMTLDDNNAAFRCVIGNGTVRDTSDPAVVTVVPYRSGGRVVAVSGFLKDGVGNVVGADGRVTIDFRVDLYASEFGGNTLYTEEYLGVRGVVVDSGEFIVELGRGVSDRDFEGLVRETESLFAEVYASIDNHFELIGPRIPLHASPYAMRGNSAVIYGEGVPRAGSPTAPIGTLYVDKMDGNRTYRRVNGGWRLLDD